jgi:adenylate cyclase
MPAYLRVTPASGAAFDLPIGNTATIGRTSGNTVCLSASPRVSRQHALIRCHNGYQYQLIDLGSRNGTFIDDQRVVMPTALHHGARIRVVDNEITFEQHRDEVSMAHLEATMAGGMDHDASGAAVQPVALLVCDIRGFSTIAEKISSAQLAEQLGAWFREAGNFVSGSGGTIDKFIGDGMLAYWSGSGGQVDCKSTLAIARKLLAHAATLKWSNGADFRVGVALHYGSVTCGNVGVDAQRDATIIGDAVNTVFRLETVMKQFNRELVLSEDFRGRLPADEAMVDLGEQSLKGKSEAVRVYALS